MDAEAVQAIMALEKRVGKLELVETPGRGASATPATSGTMTVPMSGGLRTCTPTGACTFNASGGATGSQCVFIVTTSGTSSYVLTFGTGYKSTGTLTTGTVTAKVFTVTFIYDGTNWNELARTSAM